ncbi:MAG: LptF/LptG family permease [Candidatus Solibacter usitatus]|nr:LptF/LptG family permease [Candidatus Solibacter usitatus]
MRLLSRYVFREIVSSAMLGGTLATFVIFLQQQGVGRLFELLIRSSAQPATIAWLFALALPRVLPFTVPFGVLVGILIGLGRMSTDGEITAMRAAGVPSRVVIAPVLTFAFLATLLTGASSLWMTPISITQSLAILNKLAAEQLTAEIQPRVFDEQFPNSILYVGDVRTGPVVVWRNVFLADLTPPDQRNIGLRDQAQGPRITVAREAIAVPDAAHNRIQLSLTDASVHEVTTDGKAQDATYPKGDQALAASPAPEVHAHTAFEEMPTRELAGYTKGGQEVVEARIEFQRRFALPLACIMLSLVGIPLGVSSRTGGKSAAYVTAIFLAFFCYWMVSIALIGLAKQRALPVIAAVWTPNAAFGIAGLILMLRMERPGERDLLGTLRSWFTAAAQRLRPRFGARGAAEGSDPAESSPARSFWLAPQVMDTYVLSNFLFYFVLMLASFVLMIQIYTFFELLSDIVRNKIAMGRVFTYLAYLAPKLIYDTLPMSVLVAVLVTFGVLTKHNEVTAFKACGVSLRRLAAPVLAMSVILSAGLFAFDHYYVPEANRIQDAIRNEIKGRPVQTYLRPDRKWIFGKDHTHIYYYKYFDTNHDVMAGVSVYELDPKTFDLRSEIYADRAEWQPSMGTWIFQNGWVHEIRGILDSRFERFPVKTFAGLDEPPSYFLKEFIQDKQMNFLDLGTYIRDLQQSGFDTVRLRVQLHKKFSVPVFALIMAMISIPFGFLVGNRGAMAAIGVGIAIGMTYIGVGQLFEQIGNVNQLPPAIAAWSPDVMFGLAGMYLLLRMRS